MRLPLLPLLISLLYLNLSVPSPVILYQILLLFAQPAGSELGAMHAIFSQSSASCEMAPDISILQSWIQAFLLLFPSLHYVSVSITEHSVGAYIRC